MSTGNSVRWRGDPHHLSREPNGTRLRGEPCSDGPETAAVPFPLLDSPEAIDSRRITEPIRYRSTSAISLIVALLPEDADALDDTSQRMLDI